ncbi:TonB-dependent receptor domain-containing protein [Chitinophaga niabensis]|uniref:Fe(3+) dicitrate transport protein n=1 Tax=Chitinophaga niabensis TaxID=536979 RepID=A0A1N6D6G9_9BACT|nr:TonB-dependent receptor [Chitinophaga niabensis]SIN66381.1 Fe(3+) dicitrate transport protein [Chitinophaga niabensis]
MRKFQLMMMMCLISVVSYAQYNINGSLRRGDEPVAHATVILLPGSQQKLSDENGFFRFTKLTPGTYTIKIGDYEETIVITDKHVVADINLLKNITLSDVVVTGKRNESVSGMLKDVSGTTINAGKKTEVINMRHINANLATNNTRQIYARIPGLNIWEYDRGGLQLGIGGRGLSPNRSSNFNIRQNGYDISADALGYPESYYTPSSEAIERIEIVRGAASLQYGPQFGGLINFIMKEGPKAKPFELTTRQTLGSYGFFNSFNSVGGTIAKNKLNYYAFYQFKRGDDWRPNSHYDQHNAYVHLAYDVTPKFRITGEYTLMKYLAQQPGGLTDAQFKEDPSVSVRARNWFKVDWNLISLNLDYAFNEHTRLNWRNYTLQGGRDALGVLSYINRPDNGGNRDFLSDRYSNFGSELRFIHQYKFIKDLRSTVLVGTRVYKGLTKRKQGSASDGSGDDFVFNGLEPDLSGFKFPGTNIAAFAENVFQINKHWSITPGIRFEHINTKSEGYYYKLNIFIPNERITESRSNPRSFTLLGVGTSWKFNNGTEVYANISQNYRSINFNDIRVVNANAKVDPDLKDEDGYNVDLGFRGTYRNWLYLDVSLFYLKYNGRIGSIFTRDSSFMTYRLRTNVSDSRNYGLETLLEGDLLKAITRGRSKYKLNVYTSLSLIDARYINTKNTAIADKLVENVPPVLVRTGLSFGSPRFNITYQYSYQAKQYSDATNTEETPTAVDGAVPAFSVMDLSLSYNWRKFTVYTGVNNLADEKYFTRRADGYPGPGILPADRRNLYVTLQFKL